MNVYLDMVGCRLNQAEIEGYARRLRAYGHAIVGSPERADVVILNSCSVTGEAASDSRQKIRQAARAGAEVVVTGCWSSLDPAAAQALPGVTLIVPNRNKDALVDQLLGSLHPLASDQTRMPLEGNRRRTRAFIKVQDGCDNHCTFCITRLARGESRSRSIDEIVEEIHYAETGSVREVVLTGVQIGSWGVEKSPALRLSHLIEQILEQTDIPRLRISSIEPWEVDDQLISLWQNPRLCRHFHIPLQSGSAEILKHMARRTSPVEFLERIDKIRNAIPGVSITTDVIVGFPGETDEEFLQTVEMTRRADFSGGHVFLFSARPGTPASKYPDQVPFAVRRQRSRLLREQFKQQAFTFRKRVVGQALDVLWERSTRSVTGWNSVGLSDNYIRVKTTSPSNLMNKITRTHIVGLEESHLIGEVVSNGK